MDGLTDSNEVLRNASLLLLIAVAENNAILQKIIAFENGFEIALNVAASEGGIDGGPVTEDCFALLLILLKGNQSNVGFFRETALIPRLMPFLDGCSTESTDDWSNGYDPDMHKCIKRVNFAILESLIRVCFTWELSGRWSHRRCPGIFLHPVVRQLDIVACWESCLI